MNRRSAAYLASFFLAVLSLEALAEVSLRQIEGSGGVPLNVAEAGTPGAPGILLIHGNGQSYHSWDTQLNSDLADDFHMVAYDLRGHGNSGKPFNVEAYNRACIWAEDIDAVLQATGMTKPIFVGWSRGGLIAMHYLRCRGTQNMAGIAMVASRGRLVQVPVTPSSGSARRSQDLLEEQDIEANMEGAEAFARAMTYAPLDEDRTALMTAMNLMAPPYARRAMRSPTFGPDGEQMQSYESLTSDIDVPFLAVMGDKDPFRKAEDLAAAFRAAIPQSEILIYSDVGHSPFIEKPERFNTDLRAFANRSLGITNQNQ